MFLHVTITVSNCTVMVIADSGTQQLIDVESDAEGKTAVFEIFIDMGCV